MDPGPGNIIPPHTNPRPRLLKHGCFFSDSPESVHIIAGGGAASSGGGNKRVAAHRPIHARGRVRWTCSVLIRTLRRLKKGGRMKRSGGSGESRRRRSGTGRATTTSVRTEDEPTSMGRGGQKPRVRTAASRPDDGRGKS